MTSVATPLACYRIGVGPPARNTTKNRTKKIGFSLPPENRKKIAEILENILKPYLEPFSYFGAIFSYFLGEAETKICPMFPISGKTIL